MPAEVLSPGAAPGPPVAPSASDIVCSCNAVRRGELAKAIRNGGLRTLAQVGNATRAGTGCGGCAADLEAMLDA